MIVAHDQRRRTRVQIETKEMPVGFLGLDREAVDSGKHRVPLETSLGIRADHHRIRAGVGPSSVKRFRVPQTSDRVFHEGSVEHSIRALIFEGHHRQVPIVVATGDELFGLIEADVHDFVVQFETEVGGHREATVAWVILHLRGSCGARFRSFSGGGNR